MGMLLGQSREAFADIVELLNFVADGFKIHGWPRWELRRRESSTAFF